LITAVLPAIYRIEIELPKNPLKSINSYVIKGEERNLVVDTAMNRPECRKTLASALRELEVVPKKTDLFLTHMHADHSGLAAYFFNEAAEIFCSKPDGEAINAMSLNHFWEEMHIFARLNGFPPEELAEAIDHHPGHKYCNKVRINFRTVRENSRIAVGGYEFVCVETPGHTKGHLCLYEPTRKVLISGDHILQDISPTIMLWSGKGNPLRDYLQSLNKSAALDVDLVLPGHRQVFREYRPRIAELIGHHEARTAETLAVLAQGCQDAYQVASRMTWDIKFTGWDTFPPQQKLFACGEVLAHLQYLREDGQVVRELKNNRALFRRVCRYG